MIGSIGLEGLQIRCIVGIHPHERVEEQDLFVDISVDTDFTAAAETDRVEHTIDYAQIAEELTQLATARKFQLIETFAEESATLLFALFPEVSIIALKVRKPAAVPAANCSFVQIRRNREAL